MSDGSETAGARVIPMRAPEKAAEEKASEPKAPKAKRAPKPKAAKAKPAAKAADEPEERKLPELESASDALTQIVRAHRAKASAQAKRKRLSDQFRDELSQADEKLEAAIGSEEGTIAERLKRIVASYRKRARVLEDRATAKGEAADAFRRADQRLDLLVESTVASAKQLRLPF